MKKTDNLLVLAENACSSGNYLKAEDFCDQILMNDEKNYNAWKIKAISVDMQTATDKSRMQEVFNCFMKAYRASKESEKEKNGKEIIDLLKSAINGTVSFYFLQLENNRPTDYIINQIKNTYSQAIQMFKIAFDEIGIDNYDEYITEFTTKFIAQSTVTCLYAWKKTVAYNYYRDSYDENFSLLKDNYNVIWRNKDYRPSTEILKTFINETDFLIKLSMFAIELKTPKITAQAMLVPCENIVIFNTHLIQAQSYAFVYSEAQQSYVWRVDSTGLTAEAVKSRNNMINKYKTKIDDFNIELAKSSPEKRQEIISQYNQKIDSLIIVRKASIADLVVGTIIMFIGFLGFYFGTTVYNNLRYGAETEGTIWLIFLYICGAVFFFIGLRCFLTRHPSKATVNKNILEKERLQKALNSIIGDTNDN